MKTTSKLLFYLFFVSALSNGIAQNNWYWQNPQPQGKGLKDGKFLNPSTGFAVGDKGTIIRTIDGGDNWSIIYSDTSINFLCLSITNTNTVFAGSSQGLILKSINLGMNWTGITLNMPYVDDLDFVNENTGYAAGNKIFKTTNGGDNWIQQLQISYWFNAVSFSNANMGMAVGGTDLIDGLIYKTTNGGLNWISQPNDIYECRDIFSLDSNTAYIADQQHIFKTINGGVNWSMSYYYMHAGYESIYFTSYETGFAVGDNGIVSRTFDGGMSWYSSFISNSIVPINNFLRSVYFSDSLNGFITGDFGLFFQTTNGGDNWFEQKESIKHFYDVYFLNESTGYTCGQSGTIMKTTKGGSNWNLLYTGFNGNLNDMYFLNSEVGIAVGDTGVALKTTNGGNNWTRGFTPTLNKLLSVTFINSNLGIAGSDNGQILRTTNGGFSWYRTYSGQFQSFTGLSFASVDTVYAAGTKELLKSTNGGVNWSIIVNGTATSGFSRVQFFNSNTGYVIGTRTYSIYTIYKLLKTTNGGTSFDTISYGYKDINFSDENNGIGINYYLTLSTVIKAVRTTNGGLTYTPFDLNGISNNFSGVFAINKDIGFIVGYLGAIVKVGDIITNINNNGININKSFLLQQNYPNPFNPSTVISYQLAVNNVVNLKVYDILGSEVATLVNEKQRAGSYSVDFNGENFSSGIYFYKLEADDFAETKRMILLK